MLMNFLERTVRQSYPKWYLRRFRNERYPKPHQGEREKRRRLKQARAGRIPAEQFLSRAHYEAAVGLPEAA